MAFFKKRYKTGRDGLSRDTMINGARLITAAEPKIRSPEQFERLVRTLILLPLQKRNVKTLTANLNGTNI